MKKYIKYIFINCLFILLILASGCSSRVKLPSETPEALVIIIGKHNNSQVFDLSLRDKIREVYSHFGNIAVIVARRPQIQPMVGLPDHFRSQGPSYQYPSWWFCRIGSRPNHRWIPPHTSPYGRWQQPEPALSGYSAQNGHRSLKDQTNQNHL